MKSHPNTPGFYLEFKYTVGELVGRPLKKREVEKTMYYYINDMSPEDCAKDIQRTARQDLM